MGNECSCGEVNSAKARMFNGEGNRKLQHVHLCWDEDVEKNLLSENEETEDDNYFYRLWGKKNMNKSGEKGKNKNEEDIDKWNIFGEQLEGDYMINVKKILMYVREYEEDFFLFFKKRNATSLILLKYIVLNYRQYMLCIGDTGVVYIGEVSPNNEKHGLGVIITPDQCMYIGEFEKDQITGFGLYVHFSRSIYVGYWKGGKTNHYGMFTHTDGTFYKGFWSNDKQNEKGIEHVHENYVFLGNYRKGEKNGFGAFILKNESMYIGHIENNCFSKKGIYFFNRKKMYITNWEKNCIGGACEIVWSDRRQFYGYHCANNRKEGIGIYKWNDGRIYFGNWLNNKQHGYGIFIVIKNIREYERREKAPFFLFFEQTKKVKEYFFLTLLKESFFEKGRVRGELELAIWGGAAQPYAVRGKVGGVASQEGPLNGVTPQCNNLHAYLFLNTLLRMRYYQTCRSYFDHLEKKKCNSFKFNCTFYERVKEHICSVTNSHLNGHLNRRAGRKRWGGSDSPVWSVLQGEAGNTSEEAGNTSEEAGNTSEEAGNTSEEAGNTSEKASNTSEQTDHTDESEERNRSNGKESHQGYHPFRENAPQQKNHTEDNNHTPFEEIERLKDYLRCLNLSHISERDITPHSPLFELASRNLLLKLGRWENGMLQEWIHSSDGLRTPGGSVARQAGSPNGKKERKKKKKPTQELLPRQYNRSVIDKFLDRMSSSEGGSSDSSEEDIHKNRHTSGDMSGHISSQRNCQPHHNDGGQPPFGDARKGKNPSVVPRKGLPRGTSPILRGHKLHGEQEGTSNGSGSGDTSGRSSFEATSSTSHLRDGHQATIPLVKGQINVQSSSTDMNSIRKAVYPGGVPTESILHKESSITYEITKESDKVTTQDRKVNRMNRGINQKGEDDQGDVDSIHENDVRHAMQGEKGSRLGQESDSMGGKKREQRNGSSSRNGSRGVNINDSHGVSKKDPLGESSKDPRGDSSKDPRRVTKFRPHFPSLPEKDEGDIPSSVTTSHNYDLPKKGFSLIWSLKRMKNSHLSANENITFEAPQPYDYGEDSESGTRHKKKKSFFGRFLQGGRRTRGEAKREE
ncbi:hypothetical protein C922_02295 [Plasmodium inui San Antonio 1]|uniref:Phosphatidylinositol-4-phosphate 5-kinase n=1 Tax=Plasmodium inui San Antonio 1 TaxID=1237626 RepID=W7A5U3_9APIC|nr:hypothetical protein C922_02295 [Plasmodium inui San Antonio 1]EUD67145.1 hypothetical protein C922_02295 [Plasmodium inui San Antonio 1]